MLKNVYRLGKDGFAFRCNLTVLTAEYDEVGVALPAQATYSGSTIFLRGENSGYIDETDQNLIRTHFPEATVVTVKNAGHWLHAENPADFYAAVLEFLNKSS